MAKAKWTSSARSDLKEVALYIGRQERRPFIAAKSVREIKSKCDDYANAFEHGSEIGTSRPELGEKYRSFSFKRWVIIFRPIEKRIEVLRVVDGARDYPRLFQP